MTYKPENVKLVVTHDNVEQEVAESNESTRTKDSPPKKTKVKEITKSKRCKDTIDWVEEECGDAYEKPHVNKKQKQSSQSCKQSLSSTLLKHLTKCEIESLRQNKRDAYEVMMKMN